MDYEQDGEIFEAFKSKLNKREQTADLQRRRALGRKRKADFKTCAVLGDLVLQLSRQKPSVAEFFLQMLNERLSMAINFDPPLANKIDPPF